MNVADMLADINFHGFDDTPVDQKLRVLNDTIWDIDSREKWPYLIKSKTLDFDGASPTPTTPLTDMKAVQWISDPVTGEAVWSERLENIRSKYAGTETNVDVPFKFYFVGQQLRFYPTPPASTGRFLLDYVAIQPAITETSVEADILLPARHQRIIVLGALVKLYAGDDDPELASEKQQEFDYRLSNMRNELLIQQYQRSDAVIDVNGAWDLHPWIY